MTIDFQPIVLYMLKYEDGRGNEAASNISEYATQVCERRLDKKEKARKAL